MTKGKKLVIIILLLLILLLTICICKKRENFQYNQNYENQAAKDCSKRMDKLVNIIKTLKAANIPEELRQAYAITIISKDPKYQEDIVRIVNELEISDDEKQKYTDLGVELLNKGIVTSLNEKKAYLDANTITKFLSTYENKMLHAYN